MADYGAIWKFELRPDVSKVDMPRGARPLHVACQDGAFMLWALVDPNALKEPRWFHVAGTGHPIKLSTVSGYIGTMHYPHGGLVFHVLEVTGG